MTDSPLEQIRKSLKGKVLGPPTELGLSRADFIVNERFNKFPQGYSPQPDDLSEVPNYDKLSRGERRIMGWLPGIADSPVGEALAKFADSPFGKIFEVFDIGAEAVERGTGLITQGLAAVGTPESWDDFTSNLGAAWYAGSLAADMANLPRWRDDALEIPSDLPGIGGLVTARKQIVELTNQGMSSKEALVLVRDNYYNGLGALALRAQLHDAFFHIAADPINIVLPYVKPVERLKVATIAKLNGRALPGSITQDVAELTKLLDDAVEAGATAERLAEIERAIVWTKNVPLLTPGHQRLLKLMGEIPLEGTGIAQKIWSSRWNLVRKAFSLTPDAKAMQAATMVSDNILARIGNLSDPEDMVKFINSVADGTLSPEFGHMIVSVQGRQVRAAAQASEVGAVDLLNAWRNTTEERNILNYAARYMGDDVGEVYRLVRNGDEVAVYNKFTKAVAELGEDAPLIMENAAAIGLTDGNSLKMAVDIFADTPLISPELFRINLINDVLEATTRNLVTKYGVKAKGFVVKFANMVKSAETLAFLRMNPTYPIRNFINNEFTMLARGTWGGLGTKGAELFWERLGFEPTRLRVGMGQAEIAVAAMSGDAKVAGQAALAAMNETMADATAGTPGVIDRITNKFKNINLGVFDTGTWASKIEGNASVRAFTAGFRRHWNKYRRKLKIADSFPNLSEAIVNHPDYGSDVLKTFERALHGTLNEAEMNALVYADNIGLTEGNIVGLFNERAGFELFDVFEAEEAGPMIQRLLDVADNPSAVRDEALNLKKMVQSHLQASHDEAMVDFAQQLSSRVEAEGIGSIPRIGGETVDEFWGYQQKAQWDMERMAGLARSASWDKANDTWNAIFDKNNITFGRLWDRLEIRGKAISEGVETVIKQLDEAGKMTPEARKALRGFSKETTARLKSWRKNWEDFFKIRNTEFKEFFGKKLKGEEYKRTWEQLEQFIGENYTKAIDAEDDILRQIDEISAMAVPEAQRPLYTAWRDSVANVRRADREAVLRFREGIKGLSSVEREAAYKQFLPERLKAIQAIIEEEKIGIQAMMGNDVAAARYAEALDEVWLKAAISGETADDVRQLAPWQRIENYLANQRLATEETTNLSIKLRDDLIDVAEYEIAITKEIPDISDEIANEISILLETQEAAPALGIDIPSMPDFSQVVPDELFKGIADEQLWFNRGDEAIDVLRDSVLDTAKRKDLKLSNLDAQSQQELRQFIELAKGKLADDRYQATKFGEWMRDSALLNYNRRHNYNTWLGVLAPYEFWFTQSAWKWALHSLDRPAMAGTYFKMEKFLRTGFRPDRGRPSRLEGNIRIKLPFLPEWMGDAFIDPMRTALPFKQFAYPWERYQQEQQGEEYDAERVLRELVNDGEISQEDYDQALLNRNGPIWDRAITLAQQDDSDDKLNTFDFMSMFAQPHAPLMWAYNTARGKPEDIGPFLPITRSVRAVTAALGIGPNGGVNIEGAIRRELGLPEFDQWDDYRVERMATNMAAMGEITTEEALRALMDHSGPIWEEAKRKAAQEWGWGAMGSTLGLPLKFYPEGERRLRSQRDAYERAWEDYEALQDYDTTLGKFHEENPGYEARLALWKSPEDRLKSFMIDEIWNIYNDLPDLNRRELKEQMGDMFNNAFLNKETRSYDSIPPEELAVWLRLMGGEAPGQLSPATDIPPIKLTDPDFANRMQVFYDTREFNFRYYADGGIRDIQKKYFMLEKEARKQYLVQNPVLKQYWDWRRDFMLRNPDLIPYIEDDPDKRPKYENIADLEQAFAQQPRFNWLEWTNATPYGFMNLMEDYLLGDSELSFVEEEELDNIGSQLGLSADEVLERMDLAYQAQQ